MVAIYRLLGLVGLAAMASGFQTPPRDYDSKNYFVVELDTSVSSKPLNEFVAKHRDNYQFEHELHGLDNHYIFSINKTHPHNAFLGNLNSNKHTLMKRASGFEEHYDDFVANTALRSVHMLPPKQLERRMPVPVTQEDVYQAKRMEIVDSSQEIIKEVSEKLDINDPIFIEQWHLVNAQFPGHDVNVTGLWYEGIAGHGVVTALVDDGLDYESEDLKANFNADGSWDYNDNTKLPLPRLFDDYHGTRCAGEIAAVKNDVCGVGVAYNSSVSGIRILSGRISSADEAAAMMYGLEVNDIYSCSWGPTDNGKTVAAPDVIVKKAMIRGVQKGRKDKGAVYVFASGNGGRFADSCNFDGYTNSIFSITVGAIDYKGQHPLYSEACAAVMVVTYSSGSGEHIHTTDIHGKCSSAHGGTSAAAPLAAGVYALVLEANPNLTWRDVQYVSVLSSQPINEDDGNYQLTALKRKYSHKYGYGKLDAYTMVHFAKEWKNVKPQAWYYSDVMEVKDVITSDPATGLVGEVVKHTFAVTEEDLKLVNLERVEHVTVTVNILATFRGRVGVRLISPSGVVSDLATFRPMDASGKGFQDWTFMSVAHWGESGIGGWTLEVFTDKGALEPNRIVFENWQLRFFGESIDADKAEEYDLGKDYAQERRDRAAAAKNPTTTKIPEQSKTEAKPEKTEKPKELKPAESKPTESKPQNSKPTASKSEDPKPTESKGSNPDTNKGEKPDGSKPEEPEESDEGEEDGKKKVYAGSHMGQYFIVLAMVGFVMVLMFMKFHKTPGSGRRRRREDYEFDIIPGEDYSDSDDVSLDLGHQDAREYDAAEDAARDRLYDDFNRESAPDYEEEMFRIDDDEEAPKKPPQETQPEHSADQPESADHEDERLLQK